MNLESYSQQANPFIPAGDTIGLRVFNLTSGAAFMLIDEPDPRVYIVERLVRDVNFETVSIWAHDATEQEDFAKERAFHLDFNATVALVGICVNPTDPDDNDWGV